MTEQSNISTMITTTVFCVAVFSTICLYLLATEKVMINRPAPLGDYGQLVDEQVDEVPAHSLPEVKSELKKFNEGIKNGR